MEGVRVAADSGFQAIAIVGQDHVYLAVQGSGFPTGRAVEGASRKSRAPDERLPSQVLRILDDGGDPHPGIAVRFRCFREVFRLHRVGAVRARRFSAKIARAHVRRHHFQRAGLRRRRSPPAPSVPGSPTTQPSCPARTETTSHWRPPPAEPKVRATQSACRPSLQP